MMLSCGEQLEGLHTNLYTALAHKISLATSYSTFRLSSWQPRELHLKSLIGSTK